MWWPGVRIFRLSLLDREREARDLQSARAVIAMGRKVLADNPRPSVPTVQHQPKKPFSQPRVTSQKAVRSDRKARREHMELERRHLAIAERHVAKAEQVVKDQMSVVESLRWNGHDIKLAEETLRAFEANLQVMRDHRQLIMRTIDGPEG